MKQILLAVLGLIIVGGAIYYFNQSQDTYVADEPIDTPTDNVATDDTPMPMEPNDGIGDGAEPLPTLQGEEQIGTSVAGEPIMAYHYGTGEAEVVLVSGIHGGYSWNTALLGNELVAYFEDNEDIIPDNVRVTVIPVANPDGLLRVAPDVTDFSASDITATESQKVAARFNANEVDLNRNFNCEWEETGTWQSRSVSGGDEPFSEPESRAIRDYIESQQPAAFIAYYSAAGGVFASNCNNGVLPATRTLTNLYAEAANYDAFEEFDYYEITGDMVNWVASLDIPAISILLTDHTQTELNKNIRGIDAVLTQVSDDV
jgi:murein tripeptide amidase MpaA